MPRPAKIVKNELSVAIAELRRRLGHSQQSWANLLGLSIGAVARWELNQRPNRLMLKRLVELTMEHGAKDLGDVLFAEYEREFGLSLYSPFAAHVDLNLDIALKFIYAKRYRAATSILRGLRQRVKEEFPGLPIVIKQINKD